MNPARLFRNDAATGSLLALAAFVVYLRTLSPSVSGEEDAGELATAAYVLGNTHPTGYPLFTLLGRVFALLPPGDLRVIVKLNLMAALVAAAGVAVFYRLFLLLLRDGFPDGRNARATDDATRIAAAGAAATLGFSRTYWTNALNVEVYALHLLFLGIVTWLFTACLRARAHGDRGPEMRLWLLFAYALGLSFSHHLMTSLLAPAFLYLFFTVHGFARPAWIRIAIAVPPFLLGLSAYLYLPLRASVLPVANWGSPATWGEFWRHVMGRQYSAMMFRSAEIPAEKIPVFLREYPVVFGYFPLLLAVLGLWVLLRRELRLAAFTLLGVATCLFYAFNYDFDDPNFYLNVHVFTAVWLAAGLKTLLSAPRPWIRRAGALAAVAAVAAAAGVNFAAVDRRGDYAQEDFARAMIDPLDSGAVLVTNLGQYISHQAMYLQFVEGYRRDVAVVQEGSLGLHWYHRQLHARYPAFAARYLDPAARDPDVPLYDSLGFVRRYSASIWRLIDSAGALPLYFAPDVNVAEFGEVRTFPQGLALRAFQGDPPAPAAPPAPVLRPFPRENGNTREIRRYLAISDANHAFYRLQQGDTTEVRALLRRALKQRPDLHDVRRRLRLIEQGF